MRAGLVLDTAGEPGDIAAEARAAERLGFDLAAATEHVFFEGPVSNAFVTLAAAAAVTERIRLLSAVTILPMYPMALAAKMAATLDRVSTRSFRARRRQSFARSLAGVRDFARQAQRPEASATHRRAVHLGLRRRRSRAGAARGRAVGEPHLPPGFRAAGRPLPAAR